MTDTSKYKSVALKLPTYDGIGILSKKIVPDDPNVSRSRTITILVNRELKRLNGKANGKERKNNDKSNS
jgi:hypothetical protein